jgi:hypothetical protein
MLLIEHRPLWIMGMLLGVLAAMTLRKRLGWIRTGMVLVLWGLAGDSQTGALRFFADWIESGSYPFFPRACHDAWAYVPLAVQFLVTVALVGLHFRNRKEVSLGRA